MKTPAKVFYVFLLALLAITGCQKDNQSYKLVGNWQAYQVLQNGEPMQLSPSEIQLNVLSNGRYLYRSTLNYEEAGHYEIDGPYFIAMDTVHNNTEERVVEWTSISLDTLQLRMMTEGNEQLVKMSRVK